MPYIRADMADIRVTVDGQPYGDSWMSVEGANLTADITKTRPGGMGREVAVGGQATRDDVTVSIQLSDVVLGWHKRLESKVGNVRAKVALNFLGPNRLPTGITQTVVGVLAGANLPDMSADSADIALYQIVVALDEHAA